VLTLPLTSQRHEPAYIRAEPSAGTVAQEVLPARERVIYHFSRIGGDYAIRVGGSKVEKKKKLARRRHPAFVDFGITRIAGWTCAAALRKVHVERVRSFFGGYTVWDKFSNRAPHGTTALTERKSVCRSNSSGSAETFFPPICVLVRIALRGGQVVCHADVFRPFWGDIDVVTPKCFRGELCWFFQRTRPGSPKLIIKKIENIAPSPPTRILCCSFDKPIFS
jgi:hypothetical protein